MNSTNSLPAIGGLLITALLLGGRVLFRTIITSAVSGIAALSFLALLHPGIIDAATDRIASIRTEGGVGTSYGWRVTENLHALDAIQRKPLLGLGLGGEYKPSFDPAARFTEQTHYVHNGYLFLALKLGSWGLVLPLLLLTVVTVVGVREIRGSESMVHRALVAGVVGTYWSAAQLAVTQPEWTTSASVAFLASGLALLHAVQRLKMAPPFLHETKPTRS